MEQWIMVVKALQQAGLFSTSLSGKKKEGYLEIYKSDQTWKQYYFVLFNTSLCYFSLHDKVKLAILESFESKFQKVWSLSKQSRWLGLWLIPQNWLERPLSKQEIESDLSIDPNDAVGCFVLSTPIRTFILRAKHESAMNDWIQTIQLHVNSISLTSRYPYPT